MASKTIFAKRSQMNEPRYNHKTIKGSIVAIYICGKPRARTGPISIKKTTKFCTEFVTIVNEIMQIHAQKPNTSDNQAQSR